MRATLQKFKAWLHEHEGHLTLEDISSFEAEVRELRERVQRRMDARHEALLQAQEAAKAAGFNSLEELLLASRGQVEVRVPPRSSIFAAPRKPYLIPDQPDTIAYAVYKNRVPPQVQAFLNRSLAYGGRPWTIEEMHYKQIARARAERGLDPNAPWDPVKKHEELMAVKLSPLRR